MVVVDVDVVVVVDVDVVEVVVVDVVVVVVVVDVVELVVDVVTGAGNSQSGYMFHSEAVLFRWNRTEEHTE